MIDINPYQFFIFDFDGVVLQSNQIKAQAFQHVVQRHAPQFEQEFMQYHRANNGVSRFEKFIKLHRDWCNRSDWQHRVDASLTLFSQILYAKLLSCPEVPGLRAFLSRLQSCEAGIFVVSASAQNELGRIMSSRGLDQYFNSILGSPTNKVDNIQMLRSKKLLSGSGLFLGDSYSDVEAAEQSNLDFVFIKNHSGCKEGYEYCVKKGYPILGNYLELQQND